VNLGPGVLHPDRDLRPVDDDRRPVLHLGVPDPILLATWVGAAGSDEIAEAVDMPDESRSVLDQAVQTSGSATFGIVGTLIVLVSTTSLSRALTRSFAAIWHLPRPKSSLKSASCPSVPS
jgi:membrane protein